jgi:hypothetical protein
MLLFLYYPPKRSDYPKMRLLEYVWSLDPIGCLLFVSGATLVILALDWTGGTYPWSNAHVGAPLGIGLALLIGFGVYGMSGVLMAMFSLLTCSPEWKGREDGIVAHVLFQKGWNFPLSVFAFAVEG